jgi:hypothetical protein
LTGEERTRAILDELNEPERHLDLDAEMVPYVEGVLGGAELEIVESHLEDCAICRGEVDDLRRVSPAVPRRRWPLFAIAASVLIGFILVLVTSIDRPPPPAPRPSPPTAAVSPPARASVRPEWTALVDRALSEGRLPVPDSLAALRGGATVLRGDAVPQVRAFAPDGVVVETTRPRFTWPAAPGATYTVFVFDGDQQVVDSGPLKRTEWVSDRPLARGRTYSWQVETAHGDTKSIAPAPAAAKFRILGAQEHQELEAARAAHADDPLLLAVLAARAGLLEEARKELAKLASSPDPRVRRLYDASPSSTKAAQ